jgi:uncharacterized protein YfiM (DUF2279 family)
MGMTVASTPLATMDRSHQAGFLHSLDCGHSQSALVARSLGSAFSSSPRRMHSLAGNLCEKWKRKNLLAS